MTKIYKTIFALALLASVSFAQFPSSHFMNASQCLKGAYDFDGVNDYIEIPDDDSLSFGDGVNDSPFSISAWINMDDATDFKIATKYFAGLEWEFSVIPTAKLAFVLYNTASVYEYVTITSVMTPYEGKWIHVAGTYDGRGGASANDGLKLYINGTAQDVTKLDDGSYVAMNNTVNTVELGAERGTARYADGQISDTRIYGAELTATEVFDLYKYGKNPPYNPVAWYRMDGDATDSSGNGNDGTVSGAVNTTDPFDLPPCKPLKEVCVKGSYSFDRVNDNIQISDAPFDFERTDAFSYGCWIKPNLLGTTYIIGKAVDGIGIGYQIITLSGKFRCDLIGTGGFNTDSISKTSSASVVGSTWQHIFVTYDGSSSASGFKIYYNGSLDSSTTGKDVLSTSILNNEVFEIGERNGGLDFSGEIADARFYSEELTATQISDLYTYGREPDATLVAHYEMEWSDPAGDSSGNGNDGTVTGAIYDQDTIPPCAPR